MRSNAVTLARMKGTNMRGTLTILALLVLLAAGNVAGANDEQERNTLMEVDRAWSESAKDVEKYLTYYAPEASVYPQGMPVATGAGAIREIIIKLFSMPGFSLQFSPTKTVVSTSGDLGYTTGTYMMTVNDASGKPITETGKYLTVWRKQPDGQWKVMEDIFNTDAP